MSFSNRGDDQGFTLVEVLVALAILSAAVSTLVAALGTVSNGSDRHRKDATVESLLRVYADAVEGATYQGTCSTATGTDLAKTYRYTNSSFGISVPSGYAITAPPTVTALNGAACTNNLAIQKITLTVASQDGRASESVDVLKYKP